MASKEKEAFVERFIFRGNNAALAGGYIFIGKKAEASGVSEDPKRFTRLVAGACRMGGIFNNV